MAASAVRTVTVLKPDGTAVTFPTATGKLSPLPWQHKRRGGNHNNRKKAKAKAAAAVAAGVAPYRRWRPPKPVVLSLRVVLRDALMPPANPVTVSGSTATAAAARACGLPVPPLIEIVAAYLIVPPLTVTTIAGSGKNADSNGVGRAAAFASPLDCLLWQRRSDEPLQLVITGIYACLRLMNVDTLAVQTVISTDPAMQPLFIRDPGRNDESISHMCLNRRTNELVCTTGVYTIRSFSPDLEFKSIAGRPYSPRSEDGIGSKAAFRELRGLACASDGSFAIVCEYGSNRIRRVDLRTCEVTTVAGSGPAVRHRPLSRMERRQGTEDGNLNAESEKLRGMISDPTSVCFDESPNVPPNTIVYITSRKLLRKLDLSTGDLTTFPLKLKPKPVGLRKICYAAPNRLLLSAVDGVHSIDLNTGDCTRFAGAGGTGLADGGALQSQVTFAYPTGLALLPRPGTGQDWLYVVDSAHNLIRAVQGPIVAACAC